MKSARSAPELASVVYKIDCHDCDAAYVGETKRQLKQNKGTHT